MNAPVRELLNLLQPSTAPDDQGWLDYGPERAERIFASFSPSDWDALLVASDQLDSGELELLASILSAESHPNVVPMLTRAVLTVESQGWIEVAETLALKLTNDSSLIKPFELALQNSRAVDFIESRVRDWLNFSSDGFATFDDYLAAYSHLVAPSVISLISRARRTPNTSLERTREE
jgi:hypothetical protein